jgi:predicted esterase
MRFVIRPTRLATGCVLVVLALLAQGSSPFARAQQVPSVAALRAELQKVQAAQAGRLPEGAWLSIAYTLDVAERIERDFKPQSEAWRQRAQRYLALAAQGKDPMLSERGKLVMRGYRSAASEVLQGYGIYVPASYDPARSYPMMIALHGGSANGNLFLGVVLGNNMNWKEYPIHLWDDFPARVAPDFIVVAPDGFGQVMWRFMGEQDVLDVLDDVKKHYHLDEDRVVLSGLSNGGVGAYNMGMRHASRFSVVQAIAGAPSWLQYAGGQIPQAQRLAMEPLSGMQLAENCVNTDFRYYHGHLDGGPMKPAFVEAFGALVRKLGLPAKERWFDAGHDLLYLVHRHGKVFDDLANIRRPHRPSEVRVVTGDYRAARQHWVQVTRIDRFPELARVKAVATQDRIVVDTTNTLAFSLDLREAPVADGAQVSVVVDGKPVCKGSRAQLTDVLKLARDDATQAFHVGAPSEDPKRLDKKPGSSGPITDAYYDAVAHVYGTADPAATAALKNAAERGAQGSTLWLWRLKQPVVADTDVTDALMRSHHLVLYGTPGSNRVLERIASQLPIRIEKSAVVLGARRFEGAGVGVKFIYPNPLAPGRYVIVQAAPTTKAVIAGLNTPDFLPDYVVYDARATASRARLVFERGRMPPAMGYFDRHWRLPDAPPGEGGDERPHDDKEAAALRRAPTAPNAPAVPPAPTDFASSPKTQAGQAARRIAKAVASFTNYRAKIARATWTDDDAARWSIRDNEPCLAELRALNIPFRVYDKPLTTPVAAPIELTGPVDGVAFQMIHPGRTMLMSCELAARLPAFAAVLKAHHIERVAVISAYRDHPHVSFHTLGLALDVWRFFTADDMLSVLTDFEHTPGAPTCDAPPGKTQHARELRAIACELSQTHKFSSVLTPNYNKGHHDHFHVDVRPDDGRFFVR